MHITHSRVQVYPGLASQPAARHASPVQLTPVEWARQILAFTADPQQSIVLDSAHRRVLVNCCRQWGKSTTAAVRALHHAVHNPSSETILVAPTQRQSAELLRKIKNFSQSLLNTTIKSDGTNRHAIQFTNRARILALSGKRDNIRGFSRVSLLIIDEAAWVPDTLYFAVRPFLAASPNASLLVMSTPNGDSGFFHQTWVSQSLWQRITVQATDCPRISASFLEEELLDLVFWRECGAAESWAESLKIDENEEERHRLRKATYRGMPLGSEVFVEFCKLKGERMERVPEVFRPAPIF